MKEYVDILFNGFLGDAVIGGSYLANITCERKKNDEYHNSVFSKMNGGHLCIEYEKKMYNSHIFDIMSKSSLYSLKKTIDREIENPSESDYFFINNRGRRFILMGTVSAQTKLENRKPFFDNDFIEFVYSLPNEIRSNSYIYNKMLLKFFPATFRYIPWQKTGMPICTSKNIARGYRLYRICKSVTNRLLQKMNFPHIFKNNMDYTDYNNWMRDNKELRKYVSDTLLSEKSLNRGYFNSDFIRKLIDAHMSGKKNYAQILGLLITFELFNRMFIDGEKL